MSWASTLLQNIRPGGNLASSVYNITKNLLNPKPENILPQSQGKLATPKIATSGTQNGPFATPASTPSNIPAVPNTSNVAGSPVPLPSLAIPKPTPTVKPIVNNQPQSAPTQPVQPQMQAPAPAPSVPVSYEQTPVLKQTSDGRTINPATGGVSEPTVNIAGASAEKPAMPDINSLLGEIDKYTQPGQDEQDIANQIANIQGGLGITQTAEANRPIPINFITGRQKAEEARALALQQPLQAQAALLQAKRLAALDATKTKLGALSPKTVQPGESLVNPLTGEVISQGTSLADKNALDTFFNLQQTYPDANVVWDPSKSAVENLTAARQQTSQSPSFQAKNTVYAINPLTGEPQIISKMGGGGSVFGGGNQQGQQLSIDNLAPELKGAMLNINGNQFFDSSKVTSAQLPYLQRAAQQLGVPVLSKEDTNKIQDAFSSFSSANALVQQISDLTSKVITAADNAGSQTAQAAKLKAIELAPSLSTNNDAKQFIAARNSVLSLLTRASGEKGVLTDQDVARIAQALPSYGDSATLAEQKAANFSNVLNSVLQGAVSSYLGTAGGGTSQDDPLGLFNKPLSSGEKGSAEKIAAAIKQVESGGNYNAKGASGESGAYQFMPATWKNWAKQYLGNANAPMTQANQDKVAQAKINDLLKQGYTAEQIALIWNGGQPVVKKGTNSFGVSYDSGAYAKKVLNALG